MAPPQAPFQAQEEQRHKLQVHRMKKGGKDFVYFVLEIATDILCQVAVELQLHASTFTFSLLSRRERYTSSAMSVSS